LTQGQFGVNRFESVSEEFSREEVLSLAGALEQNSEHPIAVGILKEAKSLNLNLPRVEGFKNLTGKGIEARVEGRDIKVVSPGYLKEKDLKLPAGAFTNAAETVVFVLVQDKIAGFIALADKIRLESFKAIETFQRNKIKVMMATGDNKIVAEAVAKELGL